MKVYDALIVGAGPAGSFAAELLARAGARVALFDGRPPDEPKACGGGVTSKGLKAYPFLLDAAARTIDEVLMYSPTGRAIRLKLDEPFAVFSRRNLDAHLCERARKQGAEIFKERVALSDDTAATSDDKTAKQNDAPPQSKSDSQNDSPFSVSNNSMKLWRVRNRAGQEWRGRVLVAANGANSAIAKRLAGALANSEMEVAFGYRAPLVLQNDAPTVIAFLPGYAGYAWAFPRLDHISFGIATAQSTFNHKELDKILLKFIADYYRASKDGDKTSLRIFRKQNGRLNEQNLALETDSEVEIDVALERYAARIPGVSPQVWARRRAAGENWALLGDAAGFADPVTGEGIYYALRSAELFAQAFVEGNIASFETKWRADFGRELVRAGEMRARFYGAFWGADFTDRMIQFAIHSRGIRRTLCELIGGEQGYIGLKKKLLTRALLPFKS
jgi:flavin-dependent dehydrogenase